MKDFQPIIPDNVRLAVYLISGIGTPLVTLIFTLLGVLGKIDAQTAAMVIAATAAFFGSVAGLFGISNFTKTG